jgi:hypothetical protein
MCHVMRCANTSDLTEHRMHASSGPASANLVEAVIFVFVMR